MCTYFETSCCNPGAKHIHNDNRCEIHPKELLKLFIVKCLNCVAFKKYSSWLVRMKSNCILCQQGKALKIYVMLRYW